MKWFHRRVHSEEDLAESFRQGYALAQSLAREHGDILRRALDSERREAAYWRDLSQLLLRSGGLHINEDQEP